MRRPAATHVKGRGSEVPSSIGSRLALADLWNDSATPALLLDAKGLVSFANRAFQQRMGRREHEMLGQPPFECGDRPAIGTAPGRAVGVHADVELEDPRRRGHEPRLVQTSRPARRLGSARMDERLRTLSEAECYERCYGWRWSEDSVKVLRAEPDLRLEPSETGERLRRLLELRLDAREAEAA